VATVAGGLWLLTDVLRMWTPSLITIFGRAAETPPELIGAFALACGAAPLLLLLLPRTERVARLALVLLLVARLALLLTDGGRPQLVVASAGVVVGLWWLALAVGRDARHLVAGLAWGLLLATTAHAALGTYGAVWRRDLPGYAEAFPSAALVLAALVQASRRRSPGAASPGRRAAWLVMPVLLLCGVVYANAGRAWSTGGTVGLLACVAGTVLAVAVCGRRPGRRLRVLAGVVLVAVTAVGTLLPVTYDGLAPSYAWAMAPVFLLGTPAVLLLLESAVSPSTEGRGGPRSVAGGAVLWVVLLFVYYAGYDLGYRADVVLVALSVVVAAVALTAPRTGDAAAYRVTSPVLVGVAVVALALAVLGPRATLRPLDRPVEASSALRVVAYNLRMGYGIDGRFDARSVAELLQRQHADVILLSEVDRGWLLNGGQDELQVLARLLDMHAAFGPAADPVWGDAILSTEPLRRPRSTAFASYGAVTGAQALTADLTWKGRPVTVVSTHLQPGSDGTDDTVGQAAELAALMARSARGGRAVVAGGDLNTTPGSKAWRELADTGFDDLLATARPLLTAPADRPDEQIDHLFGSPGVTAQDPHAIDTRLSDHLPVVVELTLP
jgi:endonuclease/exonuclease/phosphatase family metal-dependent hydrolase